MGKRTAAFKGFTYGTVRRRGLPFLLGSIVVQTLWGMLGDRKRAEREDDPSTDEDAPRRC